MSLLVPGKFGRRHDKMIKKTFKTKFASICLKSTNKYKQVQGLEGKEYEQVQIYRRMPVHGNALTARMVDPEGMNRLGNEKDWNRVDIRRH